MSVSFSIVEETIDPQCGEMPKGKAAIRFQSDAVVPLDTVVPLVCIADETKPKPAQKPDIEAMRRRLDTNALRRLSDLLLLPKSMLPPQDRAYATDLLHAELMHVEVDFRIQLAGRLARMGKIAPSLIARLVRDEDIAVAEPLLRLSEAVVDMDLIDILRSGCKERSLIIAGRRDLSSDIVSEIAAQGNDAVLVTLFQNRGVCFDSVTMPKLSKRVQGDLDLCELLLERPEMGPGCALELFWSVNRKLRVYILNRFLQDGQAVRQILEACTDNAGVQRAVPNVAEPGMVPKSDKQDCLMTIAHLMTQANGGDAAGMLTALASISGRTAASIVADTGGEAIMVAFKAAGASRATFARGCELWLKAHDAPLKDDKDAEVIFEQFDRLSRGQARMAISYWDWRENRIGPYEVSPEKPKSGFR